MRADRTQFCLVLCLLLVAARPIGLSANWRMARAWWRDASPDPAECSAAVPAAFLLSRPRPAPQSGQDAGATVRWPGYVAVARNVAGEHRLELYGTQLGSAQRVEDMSGEGRVTHLSEAQLGGQQFLLTLAGGPPAHLEIWRVGPGRLTPAAEPLINPYPARMASAGDVDGDGQLDVLILVYKRTRYHQQLAWRPFLYTLKEGEWRPKWLGSRVGYELLEALLVRTPVGVRMLTLERTGAGTLLLTLYHWRGFGFWGEWTEQAPAGLRSMERGDLDGDGIDEVWAPDSSGRLCIFGFEGPGYRQIEQNPSPLHGDE